MWLVLMMGCGWSVGGHWNLDRVAVADAEIFDAGFMDLRGSNNKFIAPPVIVINHWFDLDTGEFVPDPTPQIWEVQADVQDKLEGGVLEFVVAFPVSDTETVDVPFSMNIDEGRSYVLRNADFVGGELVMDVSR